MHSVAYFRTIFFLGCMEKGGKQNGGDKRWITKSFYPDVVRRKKIGNPDRFARWGYKMAEDCRLAPLLWWYLWVTPLIYAEQNNICWDGDVCRNNARDVERGKGGGHCDDRMLQHSQIIPNHLMEPSSGGVSGKPMHVWAMASTAAACFEVVFGRVMDNVRIQMFFFYGLLLWVWFSMEICIFLFLQQMSLFTK